MTEVLGAEMRFREFKGPGPTIVFIHGYRRNMTDWEKTIALLPQRHMVILDLIGYGGSERSIDLEYDWESQSKHVLALLDQLDIHQFILVGHSMGGTLVAWMAAKYPDRILGSVYIAPPGVTGALYDPWHKSLLEHSGLVNRVAETVARSWLYRKILQDSLARQGLENYLGYGKSFENTLYDINHPAMLIMSPGDDRVRFQTREVFLDRIKNLTFVELPEYVGHMAPLYNPELLAIPLEKFFSMFPPDDGRMSPGETDQPTELTPDQKR